MSTLKTPLFCFRLKFFNKKTEGDRYKGGRDLDTLKSFVEDQLNPKKEEPKEEEVGRRITIKSLNIRCTKSPNLNVSCLIL